MLLDSLFDSDLKKPTPRDHEPAFDAANVLRLGRDLIYLVSATGNELGGHWLQSILGDEDKPHRDQPHRDSSYGDKSWR